MTAKTVGNCAVIAVGQDHRLHADGRRLGETHLGPGHPAHLAAKAEFADDREVA